MNLRGQVDREHLWVLLFRDSLILKQERFEKRRQVAVWQLERVIPPEEDPHRALIPAGREREARDQRDADLVVDGSRIVKGKSRKYW
jgi:hypothetical protein